MTKTAMASTLILTFLLSAVAGIQLIKPTYAQTIAIKPDGSVEGTDRIQREGNVYTLTGDLSSSLQVQKGSIIIDGRGHAVPGINLVGPDLSHRICENVLVKNTRLTGGSFSVGASNNSFTGNLFEKGITLQGSANVTGNLISHNTFRNTVVFVDYNPDGLDIITENNFVNSGIYVGVYSPAPNVDKNYWSNYTAKYPDAKEVDDSGVWDTPYMDDKIAESAFACVDYHPLQQQVELAYFPVSPEPTPTPFQSATPEPTYSPEPTPIPESFPPALILVSVVVVAVVGLGLLVYFKKREVDNK